MTLLSESSGVALFSFKMEFPEKVTFIDTAVMADFCMPSSGKGLLLSSTEIL